MLILSSPPLITLRSVEDDWIGPTSATSISVTLNNTVAGSLLTAVVVSFQGVGSITPAATVTASNGTLFANPFTSPFIAVSGLGSTALYYGANNATGGSVTLTFNTNDIPHYGLSLQVHEWAGAAITGVDVGIAWNTIIDNFAFFSIPTNGVTTQLNQLVLSAAIPYLASPILGANQIPLPGGTASYQNETPANAVITHTIETGHPSGATAMVIAAFKRR